MTLLWSRDPAARDAVSLALGGASVEPQHSIAGVLRALDDAPHHQVIVVGADVRLAEAARLAEDLRVTHPGVGVLLLRDRVDVDTLNEALRSGIRDVVDARDGAELAAAMRRSAELSTALRGGMLGDVAGKVVTVFSAKGGVGKTTLATNLAVYLASTGAPTLLVDLDVMFGDVAISLQLNPGASLADAVPMLGRVDIAAIQSLVVHHDPSGLDVIATPIDPGESESIPGELTSEVLRVARQKYQYVVVDTPPSITEHVLSAFDVTDLAILVATLDIPAIKNMRIAINTLDTLGADPNARMLVLNRSTEKVGLSPAEVEGALHAQIRHQIPHSLDVPASVNRGVPLVSQQPKHAFSTAVRALADEGIRERFGEATSAPAGASRKKIWGKR